MNSSLYDTKLMTQTTELINNTLSSNSVTPIYNFTPKFSQITVPILGKNISKKTLLILNDSLSKLWNRPINLIIINLESIYGHPALLTEILIILCQKINKTKLMSILKRNFVLISPNILKNNQRQPWGSLVGLTIKLAGTSNLNTFPTIPNNTSFSIRLPSLSNSTISTVTSQGIITSPKGLVNIHITMQFILN